MLKITIPIAPRTKKNSQRIVIVHGKTIIIPSKLYKDYEKEVFKYLPKINKPIDYEVNVKCIYYMPTLRRVDLTNLLECTDDVLVKYGILEDDNYHIIDNHDGSRVYYDKFNPRTEIEITKKEI